MCGICGIVGIRSREAGESAVRHMMASLIHRGPDAEGVLIAPPVAVGMRRLSIIDLPGGGQPVWNETETLAVIFNGEIYNFRELRDDLQSAGHEFRSHSDTEVIVHAYEAWGQACVERLNGMFAFAVVEMPEGRAGPPSRVFLARDRLGIKPLYYAFHKGAMYFASEVRALLASGCFSPRVFAAALTSYLLFGSVCEPTTLVEGVASLPPGHCLGVAPAPPIEPVEPKSYWNFPATLSKQSNPRVASSSRDVRMLLEEAVRTHLVADVPVGIFLSSGLDSTAIAALASRAHKGIHTLTVAFPDLEFSEADRARRTAESLGTQHREITLSDAEMLARLDEAISAFDQPSMDGINTYFVSWAARQAGLKVALSGLGGDELFGGYPSFRSSASVARLSALARILPQALRSALALPFDGFRRSGSSPDASRKILAAWLDPSSLPHPYFFTRALFTPQVISSQLRDAPSSWGSFSWWRWFADAARKAQAMDGFTGVSWLELRSYLLNTLLRDTDAMSMAHSLEVRVPFLDSPLVEFVLSLPESAKRAGARPKALLVEALQGVLPAETLLQPKRTFTFPWEIWLRGALAPRVRAGLAEWSPALAPHLDGAFALAVWDNFLAGRSTWSRPWSLYVLNEWAKRHLGPSAFASRPTHATFSGER